MTHPLQNAWANAAAEQDYARTITAMIHSGQLDGAAAKLLGDLATIDSPLANLCAALTPETITLSGWDDISTAIAQFEGDPVNKADFSAARRAGKSARIASRCASLAPLHIAISSIVRPQPVHRSRAASNVQIFVQGESTFTAQWLLRNRKQSGTLIFRRSGIKQRRRLEMLIRQCDVVQSCEIKSPELNLARRLSRLFKRDRVNIKRIIALIEDVGRELHLNPVVSGYDALLKRNRFEQGLVC